MSDIGTRQELGGAAREGGDETVHWLAPALVALIGAFMSILDSSIVNVAIPKIMSVFNAGTSDVEWVATAYLLALGAVVPLSGWLGDRIGFKALYMLSMGVFVFGSFLCTLSWSINTLIAARVIQALGGGMIMPTTMAMVFRMVPKNRIGAGMGVFGIALLVAPALGPTLGGYLVEYVNWRWIFTINLPVGVIGILLSVFVLPNFAKKETGRLDVAGLLTSAGGLICLLLALSKGSDWGWGSEGVVFLFFLSFVALFSFVCLELTTKDPLLDLRVFRNPAFTLANLTIVVTTIGMYAGLFYLPLFLQSIRGLGAMETGLLMMPGALVAGVMMPVVGRLYDRIGPRLLVLAGLVLLAVLTYQFRLLDLSTSFGTVRTWILIRGLVLSFANMPAQTAAIADLPDELVSRASAVTNIIRQVSSSFGIAILTTILNHRIAVHSAQMTNDLTPWSAAAADFMQRLSEQTGGAIRAGSSQALLYLQGQIQRLAFVRGIDDVFIVAAALTLFGLLPALFLKRGKRVGPMAPAE